MQRGHRWGEKHKGRGRGRRESILGACECPHCGYKVSNSAAVPCSSIPCPQCGAPMRESN